MALLKTNLGFHQEAIALLKEVINTYPSINDFPENNNNNNNNNIVANKAGAYNILGESYFALNSINNNDKYLDSTLIYYNKAFLEGEKFIPKHKNSFLCKSSIFLNLIGLLLLIYLSISFLDLKILERNFLLLKIFDLYRF